MRRGAAHRCPVARHGRRRAVQPLPDDGRRRRRARPRGAPRAVGHAPGPRRRGTSCSPSCSAPSCTTWAVRRTTGASWRSPASSSTTSWPRPARPRTRSRSAAARPTGALGYLVAYVELVEQCRALGMQPAAVVHTSSSGGTHAGLVAGRALLRDLGQDDLPDVLAIGVAKGVNLGVPDVAPAGRRGARRDRVGCRRRRRRHRDRHPLARTRTTACRRRRGTRRSAGRPLHGGWVLDRTYTGKGFAGLLGNAATGRWRPGDRGRVPPHRRAAGGLHRGRRAAAEPSHRPERSGPVGLRTGTGRRRRRPWPGRRGRRAPRRRDRTSSASHRTGRSSRRCRRAGWPTTDRRRGTGRH